MPPRVRVHHLNCATLCALGGGWIDGEPGALRRAALVCHVLLVETNDGLVLVDTGLGVHDLADPAARLGRFFLLGMRPTLDPTETAVARIRALGLRTDDVRHVVLTHLDLDHAGGLSDFPDATVHVMATEHRAAHVRPSLNEKVRYRPAQWAHAPRFALHEPRGERWHGFECVRDLPGLPPEILMVPLAGHTRGHAAIAVDTGPSGWLLHCGDAYFHRDEVHATPPRCPPGLAAFQRNIAVDDAARRANQRRLRRLAAQRGGDVRVFCAHDARELAGVGG